MMGVPFFKVSFSCNLGSFAISSQIKSWGWIPDEILTLNSNLLLNPGTFQFAFYRCLVHMRKVESQSAWSPP